MKILLAMPPIIRAESPDELTSVATGDNIEIPIGLYILATLLLDEGFEVKLVNLTTLAYSDAIQTLMRQFG